VNAQKVVIVVLVAVGMLFVITLGMTRRSQQSGGTSSSLISSLKGLQHKKILKPSDVTGPCVTATGFSINKGSSCEVRIPAASRFTPVDAAKLLLTKGDRVDAKLSSPDLADITATLDPGTASDAVKELDSGRKGGTLVLVCSGSAPCLVALET